MTIGVARQQHEETSCGLGGVCNPTQGGGERGQLCFQARESPHL